MSVKADPDGRWRDSPLQWVKFASFASVIALGAYVFQRDKILKSYPTTNYLYRPEMGRVMLWTAIPVTIAIFLMALIPENRCNSEARLRGLEQALMRPANKIVSVHVKSAMLDQINLFTEESLCRAIVDIEWADRGLEKESPIWYQVIHFNGGWGSHVSSELQENEDRYQNRTK